VRQSKKKGDAEKSRHPLLYSKGAELLGYFNILRIAAFMFDRHALSFFEIGAAFDSLYSGPTPADTNFHLFTIFCLDGNFTPLSSNLCYLSLDLLCKSCTCHGKHKKAGRYEAQ